MTEREIRQIIMEVCAELDRRARAVGRIVAPSVIGAGLALGIAGCDDRSAPLYSAPAPDGKVSADARVDGQTGDLKPAWEYPPLPPYGVPNPDMAYGVPWPDLKKPDSLKLDFLKLDSHKVDLGPVVPPYMGPDIGPPQPDYMVPDPDGGSAALYSAPPPKLDK
jgi:hypothetical protein